MAYFTMNPDHTVAQKTTNRKVKVCYIAFITAYLIKPNP
jgi:hypothetical protein